ncbi:Metallo-dependent phosphatase-like protein [Leucosporidium creatinivorum]|uniref:Metallo-dependent phosphatase-like protein n=1 Tax=Leucosporidium creatinivorum TaxID=106004 RepID=A0A1Y2EUQ3_9BASI|nr:Metallo-dependent phosphatase-like protein [Leucosporidium creatinivorum]
MRIAVIGCSHGGLSDIYASVERCEQEAKSKGEPGVDLMICCGDFQAMRSPPDLHMMACPPKFRTLGQFHDYYAERKKAPFLTIVIGGNHESSGYMWENYHGGWLAPDIYFLGFAGCVLVDGWLRIGGASGIFKQPDFTKGHFETVPYDDRTIRSVYHIRQYDVARLLQLKSRGAPMDVFLSHDWPLGIEQHGDTGALIREKPFFKQEIEDNRLGSPPLHALLTTLQPKYWFSAHLHVKFAALYHHSGKPTVVRGRRGGPQHSAPPPRTTENPDEIMLVDEDDDEPPTVAITPAPTTNPDEIMLDDDEDDELAGQGIVSEEKGCKEGCGHAHEDGSARVTPDEIDVEMDDDEEDEEVSTALLGKKEEKGKGKEVEAPAAAAESAPQEKLTRFLALSKPAYGKDFLQIVDIPTPAGFERSPPSAPSPSDPSLPTPADDPNAATAPSIAEPPTKSTPTLFFDPHWLAIVKTFAPYLSLEYRQKEFPPVSSFDQLIGESLDWVKKNVGKKGDGLVEIGEVQKFVRTAPATGEGRDDGMPSWYTNPQTEAFCALIGIPNQINPVPEGFREAQAAAAFAVEAEQKAAALAAEEAKKQTLAEARAEALREVEEAGTLVDEEPVGEKE